MEKVRPLLFRVAMDVLPAQASALRRCEWDSRQAKQLARFVETGFLHNYWRYYRFSNSP